MSQSQINPISGRWPDYQPEIIEPKWQRYWLETGLYKTPPPAEDRLKYYCLDFFPYPSGDGLHVGHCRNYVPTDLIARYKRMRGHNVLHPMGWDAFGEPAEQHAVQHGVHPRISTDRNTANFRRQMQLIGTSYDWSREIDSSKPVFYRWTQWFFVLLYKRGLAYRDTNWQWWCPVCKTTLSSHEAANGVCWRGHEGITKRKIPAWYFKITAYADALLAGLDTIDWPDQIKTMQRNWIGRSEGVEIDFRTDAGGLIPVYTTRPDTIYGTTFLALGPEHPFVDRLTTPALRSSIQQYCESAIKQGEIERSSEKRPLSGVFTGGYVTNPLNKDRIPVWVADYVLPSYGTGAVMGVPAHDQRDYVFARQYDLPIQVVISPPGYEGDSLAAAYTEPGIMVNSGPFNGKANLEASVQISDFIESQEIGRQTVNYRMRDWLISRQRYWGTPIPIVHCATCGEVPVPEEQLPVMLPPMGDFSPDETGRSPLARASYFVNTPCPSCASPAYRETDTMGGFACSSWYFLRFTNPAYDEAPFDPSAMSYWMPVDLYVGGAEHALLHLLYARFWTYVLHDVGMVPFQEPFQKLLNQGILHGPDGYRMSKARRNVITPDEVVAEYGADSFRLYVLFMAPFDQDVAWSSEGIQGTRRFLQRVWNLCRQYYPSSQEAIERDPDLERVLHQTTRRVTERIESTQLNTLVSDLMSFVNLLSEKARDDNWKTRTFHEALESLMLLLAPLAPHITEELWQLTDHHQSVHAQSWPTWDEDLARVEIHDIAIQVDGKVRAVLQVAEKTPEEEVYKMALANPRVQPHLHQRSILRKYFVPGRIMNIVTQQGNQPQSG